MILCLLILPGGIAFAEQPAVVVKTYGQHVGGNIVYHYQVTNNGVRDVVGISFAENAELDRGELNVVMPVGLESLDEGLNPASVSGPTGWKAEMIQIEDGGRFLQWESPGYPQPDIQTGQTFRFSVTVPEYFEAYLTGHFSAGYGDGKDPWYYYGVMEKIDTIPPTLSLTLTPNTLPPSDKLVPITATISVKDDYDPAPEIKLESITPNEPVERGDIRDATLGTDDRQFMLKAEREGKNKAGRSYTVIYSATDASGNQSIASARITVPHDLRGHVDHHKDGDRKDKDERGRDR
jgi:hypothetical protein